MLGLKLNHVSKRGQRQVWMCGGKRQHFQILQNLLSPHFSNCRHYSKDVNQWRDLHVKQSLFEFLTNICWFIQSKALLSERILMVREDQYRLYMYHCIYVHHYIYLHLSWYIDIYYDLPCFHVSYSVLFCQVLWNTFFHRRSLASFYWNNNKI